MGHGDGCGEGYVVGDGVGEQGVAQGLGFVEGWVVGGEEFGPGVGWPSAVGCSKA